MTSGCLIVAKVVEVQITVRADDINPRNAKCPNANKRKAWAPQALVALPHHLPGPDTATDQFGSAGNKCR